MKPLFITAAALTGMSFGSLSYADTGSGASVTSVSIEKSSESPRLFARYGDLDAFYGDLDAFYGDLDAFYGDLDAFGSNTSRYGDLDAFYGDLDAFYGDLDAFWGGLTPNYGDLDAFYGDLDAFYGDLDAFYGDLDAFGGGLFAKYGDLDAFYGDLDAFYGDLDAFYGDLDAFGGNKARYGDLDAFYGDLDAFYGDLDAFYGDLDAFVGNLAPFVGMLYSYYGDLDAFYGDLDAFYGDLDAFFKVTASYGDLDAFYGDLDAFFKLTANYGDLDAFKADMVALYGDLDAFESAVLANYGDLDAFYGDLDAFYGDLDAFYGKLDPTYGDLDAFWGNLDTFGGSLNASYGDLDAFWGNLVSFYGDLDAFYGDLDAFWSNLTAYYGDLDAFYGDLDAFSDATAADYETLLQMYGTFFNMSAEHFAVPVTMYTGTDFWQGFASKLFNKYGIDPNDASTLAGLTALDRANFFVEWRDGLMQFTGMDSVDHWMGTIHWSPRLTQDHEFNTQAVIGLLDFGVTDQALFTNGVSYQGGYGVDPDDFHGSAVVSLMVAPYDGRGIMGIAPHASVAVYNPFDETNSAGFEDVEAGIAELIANNARIINMSLGVPENVLTEDWSSVLARFANDPSSEGTIFVKAAGNDGVAQLGDINWESQSALDRLILVGATGVDREIADWSNTPGDACAIIDGECDLLMNHFIVAPGEFILVSDGNGGVMRQSGTSFAAPLVSGTAALIHGAWPWWKQHGEETVEVILRSATDLGDEGVDAVYGWGMLNAEAALSPLDWDDLRFYYAKSENGDLKGGKSADWMRKAYLKADTLKLESKGAYAVALERVGDTYRDFRIPLSTQLFGKTTDADGLARERRFQSHLYQRFANWARGGSGFGDTMSFSAPITARGDWTMSMLARPYTPGTDVRDGKMPFQTDMVMSQADTGSQLRFGYGDGAAHLSASKVFGFQSDFDAQTGGVNPVLGLATGGSYAAASMPLSDRLTMTASVSETSEDHSYVDPITGLRRDSELELADFSAQAANVSLGYQLTSGVRINLDYTQLNERDSLLGDQGAGLLAMSGGATTDAVTFGTETLLPFEMTFASSMTLAQTRSTDFNDSFLSLSDGGLSSSAFAIGLHKQGVFGANDQVRFTLSQPLQVENGGLTFTALEVVNRETGELGEVSQFWAADTSARQLNFEAIYARPVLDGSGSITAFARSGSAISDRRLTEESEVSIGGRINFKF